MASEVTTSREPESWHVTVYENGNLNFRGKTLLVNKKKTKDLDSFCDDVTSVIKPREGCVRRLATPNHGTRIHDLDDLQPGGEYVAMCGPKFKKLPYKEGPPKRPGPISPREIKPVEHAPQYRYKSAQFRKQAAQNTGINFRVFPNGDDLSAGHPINLKPFQMKYGWSRILDNISEVMQKACYGLVTLDGETVTDISSIHAGALYVALGPHERFQPKQYGFSPQGSRNASRKREPLPPIRPGAGRDATQNGPPERHRSDRFRLPEIAEDRRRVGHVVPSEHWERETYHDACGHPVRERFLPLTPDGRPRVTSVEKKPPPVRNAPARKPVMRAQPKPEPQNSSEQEEDVFHAKPVKHCARKPKPQKDYDKDEQASGFRARDEHSETRGAQEVAETDDTQTDVPIDQQEAEQIHDAEEGLEPDVEPDVDGGLEPDAPDVPPESDDPCACQTDISESDEPEEPEPECPESEVDVSGPEVQQGNASESECECVEEPGYESEVDEPQEKNDVKNDSSNNRFWNKKKGEATPEPELQKNQSGEDITEVVDSQQDILQGNEPDIKKSTSSHVHSDQEEGKDRKGKSWKNKLPNKPHMPSMPGRPHMPNMPGRPHMPFKGKQKREEGRERLSSKPDIEKSDSSQDHSDQEEKKDRKGKSWKEKLPNKPHLPSRHRKSGKSDKSESGIDHDHSDNEEGKGKSWKEKLPNRPHMPKKPNMFKKRGSGTDHEHEDEEEGKGKGKSWKDKLPNRPHIPNRSDRPTMGDKDSDSATDHSDHEAEKDGKGKSWKQRLPNRPHLPRRPRLGRQTADRNELEPEESHSDIEQEQDKVKEKPKSLRRKIFSGRRRSQGKAEVSAADSDSEQDVFQRPEVKASGSEKLQNSKRQLGSGSEGVRKKSKPWLQRFGTSKGSRDEANSDAEPRPEVTAAGTVSTEDATAWKPKKKHFWNLNH